MNTKNAAANTNDDLRPEYDLSKLKGGVQGKYFKRATAGTTLVLLEPDVAEAFSDGQTVNQVLRALVGLARKQMAAINTELPNTTLQPTRRAARKSTPKSSPRAARG